MEEVTKSKKPNFFKLGFLVLFVVGIILIFRLTPLSVSDFKPTNVKNFILRFGSWAPVVFVSVYSLRAVILVLPVGVMSLAGGLVFGKWLGTIYILMGATLGSCISFLMARYLGRSFMENFKWLHKGRVKSFDESVEKHGLKVILFLRLIPLFQYDAVNFGSGLSKMRFRDYAPGTLVGMIPGGFINALLGSSLENIVSTQFFVALGIFFLLMFVPVIYKKVQRGRKKKATMPGVS
ncbi:MAG: TVP38/TMEM64 family protein [Candidatus Zixiibacteriota bacterium]|nr:MAG: TVP38/TMEM64 family protein [candidate division Zixibacteria bacterium]